MKKFFIISFWIICLLGAFALKACAQKDTSTHYRTFDGYGNIATVKKTLIADETWLTFTKTGAKIVTTLESVFQDISLKWGTEFKKVAITYKQANGHQYKEYVILVPESTGNNINQWAKKHL